MFQAEKSGLEHEELVALQEEFRHHQRKVDEYHTLLEIAGEDDHRRFNDIQRELDKEVFDIRDTNEYHRWLTYIHGVGKMQNSGKMAKSAPICSDFVYLLPFLA